MTIRDNATFRNAVLLAVKRANMWQVTMHIFRMPRGYEVVAEGTRPIAGEYVTKVIPENRLTD